MAKAYKPKKIYNLNDLHKEQERIKDMYKDMERHMFDDLFSPKTVLTLAFSAITKRKKRKKKLKRSTKHRNNFFTGSKPPFQSRPTPFLKKISTNSFIKHTVKSWLRWQAFNLVFLLVRQIIFAIRHKTKPKLKPLRH